MYCRNCGTKNRDEARYCKNCGIELAKPLKARGERRESGTQEEQPAGRPLKAQAAKLPEEPLVPRIKAAKITVPVRRTEVPVLKIVAVLAAVLGCVLAICLVALWSSGAMPICGDGICHHTECVSGCATDCHAGDCDNGVCEGQFGENCITSADCGCDGGELCKPSRAQSRENGCYRVSPGDGYCDTEFEDSGNACADCGCGEGGLHCEENVCAAKCGDGICASRETGGECCLDCNCSAGYNCISNKCVREAAELMIDIVPLRSEQSVTYLVATSAIEPLAKIKVKNNGNEEARNTVLQMSFAGYAEESHDLGAIGIGEEKEAEFGPDYSNSILTINASREITLSVSATYIDDFGVQHTAEDSVKVGVKGKNAIKWNQTYEAAFINPRNPAIRDFAAHATSGISTSSDFGKESAAERLFLALYNRGLDYATDPSGDNLDYLQFPEETLQRRAGDCDDLAVLFAALLEAVGIESRLIHVPRHLFVGYVDSEGAIVPIETTLVDSGNYEWAKERGLGKYREGLTETWVETTSPREQWDEGVKSVELP